MSYDIGLYQPDFLKRALAEGLGDLTDADPIAEQTLATVHQQLEEKGYVVESQSDLCCELIHPNSSWGLQVSIFGGEVTFSVPFGDEADQAIEVARRDAREIATLARLGYHDPQTGEVDT